ncbi:DUF559 domain-containing protein, partial [Novosphingobium sp. HR1a]|uniref:endonuclease domain-containing protein n=1 Tax=Novosphingobium sp. HR1a TaxID=1395637 RepID=UPI0028115719
MRGGREGEHGGGGKQGPGGKLGRHLRPFKVCSLTLETEAPGGSLGKKFRLADISFRAVGFRREIRRMAGVGLRDTGRARLLRGQATAAEWRLWRYISRSALGAKFSRQMPVGPYFADFLCRELSLVVELDAYSHGLRLDYDAARDRWMAEQGYRVLRFSNEAVFCQLDGVLTVIRMEI